METEQLLTDVQAAEFLSISPSTMRVWRWKRQGPEWVKIGRCVRYRQSALNAYLDESRVTR